MKTEKEKPPVITSIEPLKIDGIAEPIGFVTTWGDGHQSVELFSAFGVVSGDCKALQRIIAD